MIVHQLYELEMTWHVNEISSTIYTSHLHQKKVFEAYASRKGVDVGALRFLLDGERIAETASPKMLELEDEDQIDCVLQQLGGCL